MRGYIQRPMGGNVRESTAAMLSGTVRSREIGRGGMGVVWHGEDTVLRRPVALELLTAPDYDGCRGGCLVENAGRLLQRQRAADRCRRLKRKVERWHVRASWELVRGIQMTTIGTIHSGWSM